MLLDEFGTINLMATNMNFQGNHEDHSVLWVLKRFHDFGPHEHLPGIKIPCVCIEAATVAP